jgi:hypothetical protein
MRKLANAALVYALLGCGAWAASHETPQVHETSGSEEAQSVTPLSLVDQGSNCCQSCPLALEGVKLEYAESGGGAAMVFTTSDRSEEAELRRRVAELAAYHNDEHKLAMLNHPHRADVQPVEGGARMDLVPNSGFNESRGFRQDVEREVKWMQQGHCPPLGQSNECVSCSLPKR